MKKEEKEKKEKNQYPPSFVMPIVKRTLDNIISPDNKEDKKEDLNTSLDPNACVFSIPDKDKFLFFLQYRGKVTENIAMKFKRLNAPCKIIMTTKKTKTIMPSLKPTVPKMLQSGVVYQISCPRCNSSYVGQTVRHLSRRFKVDRPEKNQANSMHVRSRNVYHIFGLFQRQLDFKIIY